MIEVILSILMSLIIVIVVLPFNSIKSRSNFAKHIRLLRENNVKSVRNSSHKFKIVFLFSEKFYQVLGLKITADSRKRIEDKLYLANISKEITVEGFYGIKILLVVLLFIYFAILYLVVADALFLLIALIGTVLAYVCPNTIVNSIIKKRQWKMQVELPGILNTLAIITDAGLSFNEAIKKIIEVRNGILVDEFRKYFDEVNMGFLQEDALLRMAERCQVNEISVFVSIIVQSIEKGSSGVTKVLKEHGKEVWENRLGRARELGEKASMKLFLPMMLLVFPCLFIFIIGPAVFTIMNNF